MKPSKLQSRCKLTFTAAALSTFNAQYQSDHKYAQEYLESGRNTCLLDMSKNISSCLM